LKNLIICGPVVDDQSTFWNNDIDPCGGWTSEFFDATIFDAQVFSAPLPIGATNVMEIQEGNDYPRAMYTLQGVRVI
jgi:hypothetical protein